MPRGCAGGSAGPDSIKWPPGGSWWTDKGGQQEHVCRSDTRARSRPGPRLSLFVLPGNSNTSAPGASSPKAALPEHPPSFPDPRRAGAGGRAGRHERTSESPHLPQKILSQPCTGVPSPTPLNSQKSSLSPALSCLFPTSLNSQKILSQPCTLGFFLCLFPTPKHPDTFPLENYWLWLLFGLSSWHKGWGRLEGLPKKTQKTPQTSQNGLPSPRGGSG